MIYNSIIYLLIIILILSTKGVPVSPHIPPGFALFIFVLKGLLYRKIVHGVYTRERIQDAPRYFATERKLSILAIIFTAIDVYLLDCQYYLAKLPMTDQLPALINFGGISLFFTYLAIMWVYARKSYHAVFGRIYSRRSFLVSNIKIILPIILPWLFLSLLVDILELFPIPWLTKFLNSPWGEPLIFLSFLLILAVSFPVIITRLWNCTPLPPGKTRSRIVSFCRKQRVGYADIMIWPLFEGRILTAGVMGIIKRFRYLLITPAMINSMTPEEIEAVMAHEIGHVKKYHLQLFLFLFMGFALLAQGITYPLLFFLLKSDLFYQISLIVNSDPVSTLTFIATVPMFILMIIYFRYVFGFFIRNFERQADLHVFEAMSDSKPLIRVLEKIAWLNGNIRDLPNWHHFSISQRVDFLQRCQEDRSVIKKHNRKVSTALTLYLVAMVSTGFILWKMPTDMLGGTTGEKFIEAVIRHKIKGDPLNVVWHQLMGDLQYNSRSYEQAVTAYESALGLSPDNADVLNNLAWLLLTAEEKGVLDPVRALDLAKQAARLKPAAYILDTLATAYWMNGFNKLALMTERQAIAKDPDNSKYYRNQMKKFAAPEQQPMK